MADCKPMKSAIEKKTSENSNRPRKSIRLQPTELRQPYIGTPTPQPPLPPRSILGTSIAAHSCDTCRRQNAGERLPSNLVTTYLLYRLQHTFVIGYNVPPV